MTQALRITDGTTTVMLSSTNMVTIHYLPQVSSQKDITETAEIIFTTSIALERADINSLNRLFEQARRYQLLRIGSAVYVEYKLVDTDADYYRSEIKDGRIVLEIGRRASIIWTREAFWEGPETQIPLTNGNGTNNITGLTVYNHDDADVGHDNYVSIAAVDVVGDLPAPPRLEIKNNYDSTTRAANMFVAHNVNSNPGTLAHILEAESATGGTTTENANSSGGYDKALSWEVTTETQLLDWTLSTAVLNACAGNFFRLLIRLATGLAYSDLWLKVKIKMGLTVIWESEWILAPNGFSLFELATAQLPAYLAGAGDIYPAHLVLFGKRNAAGTHYLNVDYMQLSPLDGWRKLQPQGYQLGYLARLMDDMIDDYLYTDSWDTPGKFGNYYSASAPLALIPNKLQRLYFLHDTGGGSSAIARTLGIKVFYRPRRCSI